MKFYVVFEINGNKVEVSLNKLAEQGIKFDIKKIEIAVKKILAGA